MMGFLGLDTALRLVEQGRVPDALVRRGIRQLVASGLKERGTRDVEQRQADEERLRTALRTGPVAVHTDTANEQHYELPAEFFRYCLGPRRKYSGCYWPEGATSLAEAEEASLRATCAHAELADGQRILELGCGWGSLTLWMAEHYPGAEITAVSNSQSQRRFIEGEAERLGLRNVTVVTANMRDFAIDAQFDRVVSVEMFEHMRNYKLLMQRIAGWLKPGGKLFVHIFVHGRETYLFETEGAANWMGRYFFTGGIMPSDHLLLYFQDDLRLEQHWRQSGEHYQKTADAWLQNMDAHRDRIMALFCDTYGRDHAAVWYQRWRVFYMACAEMFGFARGQEWWVGHYRFVRPIDS